MDVTEENMLVREAREKIAELEYSQTHLRELNAEMRGWLDVADDDMAALRSENAALRSRVEDLQKMISSAQQSEADLSVSALDDDLDLEKHSEEKIDRLEEESIMMKEENKKLTAELNSLEQESEQDKISLSKFKEAIQTLEEEMKEAQLVLQEKEEDINRKNMQLNYLEATAEEHSNFIKELKLVNQELRQQLEDQQNEASFFAVTDLTGDKEALPQPHLSFAEELRLLASTATEETSTSDVEHLRQGANDEEQLKPQSLATNLQTKRCASVSGTDIIRFGLYLLCIAIISLFAFVVSGIYARNPELFTVNTLWKVARLVLQPYCSVHYGALPPI